jgi:hypothetical protein
MQDQRMHDQGNLEQKSITQAFLICFLLGIGTSGLLTLLILAFRVAFFREYMYLYDYLITPVLYFLLAFLGYTLTRLFFRDYEKPSLIQVLSIVTFASVLATGVLLTLLFTMLGVK